MRTIEIEKVTGRGGDTGSRVDELNALYDRNVPREEEENPIIRLSRLDNTDIPYYNEDSHAPNKHFTDDPFDESGKIKPNICYKTGEYGYFYETDNLGRIETFETEALHLTDRTSRQAHNPNTPGKLEGDHAGHLAADRFGGSPELDNLVSQSSDVNLRQYKNIENQWARALKEGKKVQVKVDVIYEGSNLRPTGFSVDYVIDGKRFIKILVN